MTANTQAEILSGRIIGVIDGDTVTVLDTNNVSHRIRVAGIDAPEREQPFGRKSKDALSDWVSNKTVDILTEKRDRYGRWIGKIMVADPSCTAESCPKTLDAGLALLTTGMAWWYRHYAQEQSAEDAGAYEFAEQEARERHAGLWQEPNPVAPWDWRRMRRATHHQANP